MPAPTVTFPTAGSNPQVTSREGAESAINAALQSLYGDSARKVDLNDLERSVLRWGGEFYVGQEPSGGVQFVSENGTVIYVDGDGRVWQPLDADFHTSDDDNTAFALVAENGACVLRVDPNGSMIWPTLDDFFISDDDPAVVFVGENGAQLLSYDRTGIMMGYGDGGGVSSGRPVLGYESGGSIRSVGADDLVAADLGDFNALSIVPGNEFSCRAIIDWPAIGGTRTVTPAKGMLVPDASNVLHIVIGLGQSLMVGSTSRDTIVNGDPLFPTDALMFDTGANSDVRMGLTTSGVQPVLDASSLVGFLPLEARSGQGDGARGETPMEAAAYSLAREAASVGINFRTLSFTAAQGGTTYDGLKKGTQVYANMIAALTKAKTLAESRGWSVIVDGCIIRHGEGDANNTGYYSDLIEWQSDVDADVKAITGQAVDVHFILAQPSSHYGDVTVATPAMARVCNESEFHHLSGPDYGHRDLYNTDFVHGTGGFYAVSGDQIARAWRQSLWTSARKSRVTQMISAVRVGETVTLTYEVPVPPLVFDLTGGEVDTRGFRFVDSAGEVSVSSAAITNSGLGSGTGEVQLTLAATPSGSEEAVYYAMSGHDAERSAFTVPRGNLRDSSTDTSAYESRPLYNWAIHQIFEL